MNEYENDTLKLIKDIYKVGFNGRILGADNIKDIVSIIDKQQKEIEKLKGKNKELFEEYNKRVSTIIVYEQELKEIIDEEDDSDTWTYHAVKKLLEEVEGIEYE